MKCILFGASGSVGGAVVNALLQSEHCETLTLINRRELDSFKGEPKVDQLLVDTENASDFEIEVKRAARGHSVGISCVGLGSGSVWMREEDIAHIEVDLPGAFARGCKAAGVERFLTFTAVGVSGDWLNSRTKQGRVMGRKHQAFVDAGFDKLAIFRPGVIVGSRHTPLWITYITALLPESSGWGNISVEEMADAFVAHLNRFDEQDSPVVLLDNADMKRMTQKSQ